MAYSNAAISEAENRLRAHFNIEIRFLQPAMMWVKVIAGVITPFDLRDPNEVKIRDYCRLVLHQVVNQEHNGAKQQGQVAAVPTNTPPSNANANDNYNDAAAINAADLRSLMAQGHSFSEAAKIVSQGGVSNVPHASPAANGAASPNVPPPSNNGGSNSNGANGNDGPPIITSVNRHTATIGSQLVARGRNLQNVTQVELGGVTCLILARTRAYVYFQIPDSCSAGSLSLVVTNPRGSTNYATPIKVEKLDTDDSDNTNTLPVGSDGFLASLLKDPDVRRAIHYAAPRRFQPFVSPFLDALPGMLPGLSGFKPSAPGGIGGINVPYTNADIQGAMAGIQAKFGFRVSFNKTDSAFQAHDTAGRAINLPQGVTQRDLWDMVHKTHLANHPDPSRFQQFLSNPQTLKVATGAGGGFMMGQLMGGSGLMGAIGGGIGMAAGGPLGAFIGSTIGGGVETAVMATAKRTLNSVRQSRDLGYQAADGFSRGALSLANRALLAGQSIGNILLDSAMRPFGASGAALSAFGAQFGQSLTTAVMGALKTGAGGLRLAGGALGLGVGLGGAVLGGAAGFAIGGGGLGLMLHNPGLLAIGAVNSILPAMIGAGIGVIAMKALSGIGGIIGSVFDKLGQAFGELGRLGGSALKTVLDVAMDVKQTALALSQSVLSMSQNSGLSVGASSVAVNNLMGFGLSPQQTSQMFGDNVLMQSVKNVMFGTNAPSGSAAQLLAVRDSYQGWKQQMGGNPLMANQMMQSMGYQSLIPMANLPRQELLKSLDYSRGLQMPSGAVEMFGQKIGMLENRLGQFATFAKVSLANAFAPVFERGLDSITTWFKSNQKQIVSGFQGIGRWFYADLPAMVLQGSMAVVGAFGTITSAAANFVRGFSEARGPLYSFIEGLLRGLDSGIDGFRRFTHGVESMVGFSKVAAGVALHPLDILGNGRALVEAQRFAQRDIDHSNLAGRFRNFAQHQTVTDEGVKRLDGASKVFDGMQAKIQELQQGTFNRERNGRKYDEIMSGINMPENERISERAASDGVSMVLRDFREQKSTLAQAVERYSREYRSTATSQKESAGFGFGLQGPQAKTPMEVILQLLSLIANNTGKEGRNRAHITVGLEPHDNFIGKILAIEQWEDWEMLGGRVAGGGN